MKFHAWTWSVLRAYILWWFLDPLLTAVLARVSRTFPCPEACFCDLITLRVDCSRGGFQSLPTSVPINTRILLFQENDIGNELNISVFNVTAFARLRQLSLANNSLSSIDSTVFPKQSKLIKLDLAYNYLEGIPVIVRDMRLLKQLHLNHNRISSINNNDLPPFSIIEKLHLDSNQIYIIADGAFVSQKRLQLLYLSDNLISNITAGLFSTLSMLVQLDMSYNDIGADLKTQYDFLTDDIPTPQSVETGDTLQSGLGPPVNFSEWFAPSGAPNLEYLDLEGNIVKNIALDAFTSFPVLTSLNLAYNQLVSLPPNVFHTLSNIQILYLNDNRLSQLSAHTFAKSSRLEILNLSRNSLFGLPAGLFSSCAKSLLELRLSENNLQSVPWAEDNFVHLVELDLSTNAIADVGSYGFTNFVSLEKLFLQNNQLSDIPNVRNLTRLQELRLSNNSIRSISFDAFSGNYALELLALDDNFLTTFTTEPFFGLTLLHTIQVAGNPFDCDCTVIWAGGYAYSYEYSDDYYSHSPQDTSYVDPEAAMAIWIEPLLHEAVCVRPPIVSGESLYAAVRNFRPDLICNHLGNPRSIMVLILTWFLIIIVFLILFWGRTFWLARKQFGRSKAKIAREKDDDACYVISAVSKKTGNGQYHLLPDKNENEPLVFLSNHDDESCKLRTLDRNSAEIFIETTV